MVGYEILAVVRRFFSAVSACPEDAGNWAG